MTLTSIYERPNRHALLYTLLKQRDETVNISHQALPCWGDHVRFVESNPYEAWYFAIVDKRPVGACYLTRNNEIGVQIFADEQGKGYGKRAVEMVMAAHGPRRYLANINPRNARSIAMFGKLGFRHIQDTYERRIPGCS